MKSFLRILITTLTASALISCSQYEPVMKELPEENLLEVTGCDNNYPTAGGEFVLNVNTPDFKVYCDQNWCEVEVSSDGNFTLSIQPTTEMKKRSANITIASGNLTANLFIAQNGYEDERVVTYEKKSCSSLYGALERQTEDSRNNFALSYCDWIKTFCGNGKMKYEVETNTGLEQRTGSVVFVNDNEIIYYTITQEGRKDSELELYDNLETFASEGGEGVFASSVARFSVSLGNIEEYTSENTNGNQTDVVIWQSYKWISFAKTGNKVLIKVEPNTTVKQRIELMTFTIDGLTITYPIKQHGSLTVN